MTNGAPAIYGSPYKFHLVNTTVKPFISIEGYLPSDINIRVSSHWAQTAPDFLKTTQGFIGGTSLGKLGIGELNLGSTLGVIESLTGWNYALDLFTGQVWQGTEPLSFSLSVMFEANTDAYKDVFLPMTQLKSLCLPNEVDVSNIFKVDVSGAEALGPVGVQFSNVVNNASSQAQTTLGAPLNQFASALGIKALRPPGMDPAIGKIGPGAKSAYSIRIGEMYYFEDIIFHNVETTFHNRLDQKYGLPISGQADIAFGTRKVVSYETLTKATATQNGGPAQPNNGV